MKNEDDVAPDLPAFAAFISYAREDELFARQLETQIEAQKPLTPGSAVRACRVFRDRADFTGSEYHRALDSHLRDSGSLVVICSPDARKSEYVGDEIRRFAALHGAERIYPVLLTGLPNNEADELRAFPPALLEVTGGIPLAADYRSFDPKRNRLADPKYEAEWYKLLGNIHGVPPAEIRRHDERQQVRALRMRVMFAALSLLAMAGLFIGAVLLWQRAEQAERVAVEQRERAEQAEQVAVAQRQRAEEAEAIAKERSARAETELGVVERGAEEPYTGAGARMPRVYFHIRNEQQRAAAQRLADQLKQEDMRVPGIQLLRVGPTTSELRYFRPREEQEAQRIAAAISAHGVNVSLKQIPGYDASTRIPPGHFELWLAP